MQAYNLAFVVIRKPYVLGAPHFTKLACFEILQQYKRIIFVDTDILITPDAPNILAIVPQDHFGAYIVSQHTYLHDKAILLVQSNFRDIGWRHDYFNSGVMVASQMHKLVFDPSDPDLIKWSEICAKLPEGQTFSDQTYLNFKLQEQNLPLFDIGYKFNHSLAPGNSARRFSSHFIHCKGHRKGSKEMELRRADYIISRPRLRAAFANYPLLAGFYDSMF